MNVRIERWGHRMLCVLLDLSPGLLKRAVAHREGKMQHNEIVLKEC